jgi:hypothetical protein
MLFKPGCIELLVGGCLDFLQAEDVWRFRLSAASLCSAAPSIDAGPARTITAIASVTWSKRQKLPQDFFSSNAFATVLLEVGIA